MNIGVMMINMYKKNNKGKYVIIKRKKKTILFHLLKDGREQKDNDKLLRKQENQKLLEQEEAGLSASKAKTKPDLAPRKVTQAQIQERQTAAAAAIQNGIFLFLFSILY